MLTMTRKNRKRLKRRQKLAERRKNRESRDARVSPCVESQPVKPALPGSLQPLAGELDDCQQQWDWVRKALNQHGANKGEWAGCPLPHETLRLVIEPRYPFHKLNGCRLQDKDDEPTPEAMEAAGKMADFSKGTIYPINSWRDERKKCEVMIYHTGDHRSKVGFIPDSIASDRLQLLLCTMDASTCWSLDAEIKAVEKLRQLITPHAYRFYVLTGMFLESSPRSQLTYLFRKGRPTIVLTSRPKGLTRPLVALCLHPIGYYENSYAGTMVPTDDVLSHLLMMRADEKKFWSKSGQHSPWDARAGI